ncbi:MAG TPA: hypothetical protein VI072_03875 [Polyangiaceae bacterium]
MSIAIAASSVTTAARAEPWSMERATQLQRELDSATCLKKALADPIARVEPPSDPASKVLFESLKHRASAMPRCPTATRGSANTSAAGPRQLPWQAALTHYNQLAAAEHTAAKCKGPTCHDTLTAVRRERVSVALLLLSQIPRQNPMWVKIRREFAPLLSHELDGVGLAEACLKSGDQAQLVASLHEPANLKLVQGLVRQLTDQRWHPFREKLEQYAKQMPAREFDEELLRSLKVVPEQLFAGFLSQLSTARRYRPVPGRQHRLPISIWAEPTLTDEIEVFRDELVKWLHAGAELKGGGALPQFVSAEQLEGEWKRTAALLRGSEQYPIDGQLQEPVSGAVVVRVETDGNERAKARIRWQTRREGIESDEGAFDVSFAVDNKADQATAGFHAALLIARKAALLKTFSSLIDGRRINQEAAKDCKKCPQMGNATGKPHPALGLAFAGAPLMEDPHAEPWLRWGVSTIDVAGLVLGAGSIAYATHLHNQHAIDDRKGAGADTWLTVGTVALSTVAVTRLLTFGHYLLFD